MRLVDYLLEVTCGPELHDQLNALEVSWDRPEVVEAYKLYKKWIDNEWIVPGFWPLTRMMPACLCIRCSIDGVSKELDGNHL